MVNRRRRHLVSIKFRVLLLALEGRKTVGQLLREHGIDDCSIGAWKQQLPEDGPKVFDGN